MARIAKLYRKLHKWPGLIISFLLLYYGITGLFMNHREFFSNLEINRDILPADYAYNNWNNAALKDNLIVDKDSILVFGNIGVWVTDSTFKNYNSLNKGFLQGADNRKIFDVHRSRDGELYAATLFGLYSFDKDKKSWNNLFVDADNQRFVGIESLGDTIYAINRSFLFKGISRGTKTRFTKIELEQPDGYVNKVGLFETIWQIHSGEILGIPGKLFVDFMGLITIFLSATGIIYFFFPDWINNRRRNGNSSSALNNVKRWSLKWHNKTGAWFFVFLILLFFTGIFLRPPLLIAIADAKISPIKHTHMNQPNPWYDKLRDLFYDKERKLFLLSSSEGMFFMNVSDRKPVKFEIQPPVSVMGINTLAAYRDGAYLIGSFSGLFLWHPSNPDIIDYAKGTIYENNSSGRPIGDYKVTGTITDTKDNQYMVDFDKGVVPLWHNKSFPEMPENVLENSKMSLWNVSLEVHTGRFFRNFLGDFYILIVPLSGFIGVMVVLSGYLLWRKSYRKKAKSWSMSRI